MAVHVNIAAREHVEMRLTLESKAGSKYTESTGRRESVKYTGPWDEMMAMATDALSEGGSGVQVSCDLERVEGEIGELTITREEYRVPAGDEPGEDEPESPGGESELGTEAAPCYSMSSTLVQVCILAHPKFAGMGDLERRALKAMIDGQDENSLLDEDAESGATAYKRIKDCIKSDVAKKAFSYISRGIVSWNDISTEATARWKGNSNKYTPGEIVQTVPGGFSAGAGRNWLCSGAGKEKNGNETWCTASFRLSGVGGWDPYLYSDS